MVRAINYLARDTSWGTYKAELSNIEIVGRATARSRSPTTGSAPVRNGRFAYRMKITGEAVGPCSTMEAEGVGARPIFPPIAPASSCCIRPRPPAAALTIRHSDGQIEETVFPEAISPDQPAFDIAALTHEPAPGLSCTVDMEGDAFEMEDQRNWTDASFKTYVRPLSKPRPYVIAKGEKDRQRSITVRGRHR